MNILSTDILSLSSEPALLARQGSVYYMNAAACHLLGSCTGKSLKELFGDCIGQIQASSFLLDQCIDGTHYTIRVNHLDDGQLIFLHPCGSSPLLLNDALIYSMRSSLMNLNVSVDAMRIRAEDAGDLKQLSGLHSITHSCYKMMRIISNASTILAANSGNSVFTPEEINIAGYMDNLVDTVEMLTGMELRLTYKDIHPIVADGELVELIVMNLISNCLSHAKGCTRICVSLAETRDSLIISVDDDGCGIAPDKLGTVFDRYCHGFDLSNILSGAGLGLTATRSAANLHGGTLLMESRVGRGTTVRVSLSRHIEGRSLRSPQKHWESNMHSILTALSDCLPDELYTSALID